MSPDLTGKVTLMRQLRNGQEREEDIGDVFSRAPRETHRNGPSGPITAEKKKSSTGKTLELARQSTVVPAQIQSVLCRNLV